MSKNNFFSLRVFNKIEINIALLYFKNLLIQVLLIHCFIQGRRD